MGHSAREKRRLRGSDGTGARCLQTPLRSLSPRGLHGRIAPAADSGDTVAVAAQTRLRGATRLRIRTLWRVQRVPGGRTVDWQAHDSGYAKENKDAMGVFSGENRQAIPRGTANRPRDGQSEHAWPGVSLRDLCAGGGQGSLGPIRVRL